MDSLDELGTRDVAALKGMAERWHELIAVHPAAEYPVVSIGGTHYTYDAGDTIPADGSLPGEAGTRISAGKLVGPFVYRTREAAEEAQRRRLLPYGTLRHVELAPLKVLYPLETVVYVDGSCLGTCVAGSTHRGPGGWAWAVLPPTRRAADCTRYQSGHAEGTTNQRMELQAPLEALKHVDGPVRVVSDSAYVVNCFLQGWWRRWRTNGWRTASGPVKNQDLWEQLIRVSVDERRGQVVWEKVKGHSGDEMNDLVDRLAVKAARNGVGESRD
jgi:ribonuclease HI